MTTKIVRDRAPEWFVRHERPYLVDYLNQCSQLAQRELLASKVREEAEELAIEIESGKMWELIEEMGDVADVLDLVRHVYEIPAKALEEVRREKAERRGGFSKGTVITYEKRS